MSHQGSRAMTKRIIRIIMVQKVAEDSPKILDNVAKAFPQDDLEFEIRDSCMKAEEHLEHQAIESAKEVLDTQHQAIEKGTVEIESEDVAKAENMKWGKTIREAGFKAGFGVIFKEIFEHLISK